MFPTHTTSTTGTLRIPPAAAVTRTDPPAPAPPAPPVQPAPAPAAPAPRATGELFPAPAPAPAPAAVPHGRPPGVLDIPHPAYGGPSEGPATLRLRTGDPAPEPVAVGPAAHAAAAASPAARPSAEIPHAGHAGAPEPLADPVPLALADIPHPAHADVPEPMPAPAEPVLPAPDGAPEPAPAALPTPHPERAALDAGRAYPQPEAALDTPAAGSPAPTAPPPAVHIGLPARVSVDTARAHPQPEAVTAAAPAGSPAPPPVVHIGLPARVSVDEVVPQPEQGRAPEPVAEERTASPADEPAAVPVDAEAPLAAAPTAAPDLAPAAEPTAAAPDLPHPADDGGPAAHPAHDGAPAAKVPGPGLAGAVARAVAQAMDRVIDKGGDEATGDLPHSAPGRGVAVTEVPVRLPFLGQAQPQPRNHKAKSTSKPKPKPKPKQKQRPKSGKPHPQGWAPRTAAGRRPPRGDDRLREHYGPVLPGWVAVAVGGLALAGCLAVLWRAGAVPAAFVAAFGATPRPYEGLRPTHWPPLAFLGIVALLALGGLGRGKAGYAWVLTLFGRYRGTVRRTGLTWVSPLLLRRRVDVRLRHWRSEPMPAVDAGGLALQVVVQVVWQVKDTARATLGVANHTGYLAEQVESAMARVLSQLPADAFHEDAPTLRDAEAVGDALTRMLAAETEAVGIEVYSAQPTRIEYAPEVAEAMRRRRVAAIDAKHRDTVLTSIVDAVDDTVHRLTTRGLVELDDYERKALVKDLTVAFYTGRSD
ncbi:SPFH domain-containing protein [Streptomyces sp. NPDC044571]|uniref:SPFH domain-containing protein n=1 Tax=Streptomyces sp. NPDC044571 TaxID=3155371 RepID=UPI0033F8DC4F